MLELLTAKQIAVWIDTKCSVPAQGKPSAFELREGAFDLDALLARNALDLTKTHELPWPPTCSAKYARR